MTIQYLDSQRLTGVASDTKPTTLSDHSIFIETDTGKRFIFDGGRWKRTSVFDSLNESFTHDKQRFVEYFSGKQLPSYWTPYNGGDGSRTIEMSDEVDGGLKMTHSSTNNDWGGIAFNNKRQYAHDGSAIIGVVKKTYGSGAGGGHFGFGGLLDTSQGQSAALQFDSVQDANFALRTEAASGSSSASSMALDENWHSSKIDVQSSSVVLTIDGSVEVTRTATLPTTSMQPYYYGIKRSTDSGDYLSIRYCEAYNT